VKILWWIKFHGHQSDFYSRDWWGFCHRGCDGEDATIVGITSTSKLWPIIMVKCSLYDINTGQKVNFFIKLVEYVNHQSDCNNDFGARWLTECIDRFSRNIWQYSLTQHCLLVILINFLFCVGIFPLLFSQFHLKLKLLILNFRIMDTVLAISNINSINNIKSVKLKREKRKFLNFKFNEIGLMIVEYSKGPSLFWQTLIKKFFHKQDYIFDWTLKIILWTLSFNPLKFTPRMMDQNC